jgi:hypothetical protein
MVRARRTRDSGQFYTSSSRLERRNTLLPGVDLLYGGLQGDFSSMEDARELSRRIMNEMFFEGMPPRPYILDPGVLHADMITTCA